MHFFPKFVYLCGKYLQNSKYFCTSEHFPYYPYQKLKEKCDFKVKRLSEKWERAKISQLN